jgi:hypothetical protein
MSHSIFVVRSVIFGVPLYYVVASLPYKSGAILPSISHQLPSSSFFFYFRWDRVLSNFIVESISFACLVFCGGYAVLTVALDEELDAKSTLVEIKSDSGTLFTFVQARFPGSQCLFILILLRNRIIVSRGRFKQATEAISYLQNSAD